MPFSIFSYFKKQATLEERPSCCYLRNTSIAKLLPRGLPGQNLLSAIPIATCNSSDTHARGLLMSRHQDLITKPLRPQLGQHRECCALRGNGARSTRQSTASLATRPIAYAYHRLIMEEINCSWLPAQSGGVDLPRQDSPSFTRSERGKP